MSYFVLSVCLCVPFPMVLGPSEFPPVRSGSEVNPELAYVVPKPVSERMKLEPMGL